MIASPHISDESAAPASASRTANVSERISASDSSLSSPTVHPAGALPHLSLASDLKSDANSPPRPSDSSADSEFSSSSLTSIHTVPFSHRPVDPERERHDHFDRRQAEFYDNSRDADSREHRPRTARDPDEPRLPFDPPPNIISELIDELVAPDSSMTAIARGYGTTIDHLSLWMARPDIAERINTTLTAAATRVRMVATVQLATAVGALGEMVQAYRAIEHAVPIRYNDISIRSRELQRANARKAIHLLARLGRYSPFAPLNPSDLHRPEPHRLEPHRSTPSDSSPDSSTDLSSRTANISERTCASDSSLPLPIAVGGSPLPSSSDSSLPSPTVHPAGALSDLHLASSLKDDANSPPGALPDLPLASSLKDDAKFPPRRSDSSAHSAFSSPTKRARDHPTP